MSYNTHFSKEKINLLIIYWISHTNLLWLISYMHGFFFLIYAYTRKDYEMSIDNFVFQPTLLYVPRLTFLPTNHGNHPQLLFRH